MLECETGCAENLAMCEEQVEVSLRRPLGKKVGGGGKVWGTLRAALSHILTNPFQSRMANRSRPRRSGLECPY